MPEGDTIWRTAARLDLALSGAPLTTLELRWGDLGGRNLLPATTVRVVSRGKHILHELDSGLTVHTHLRMEGSWRILATPKAAGNLGDTDIRAVAATRLWTAVGLRLGMLDLWPTDQVATRLGHLGPDVLGTDWDLDKALSNLAATPSEAIGAALLDQRNLAGIGTFWASEGLFLSRVSPWTPLGHVDETTRIAIVTAIRRLMRQASQSAIQTSTGRTRRGETAYVHARSGQPCRRCSGDVRVAMIGTGEHERTMFYCPNCQGGLAPTDPGTAGRPLGSSPRAGRSLRRPRPKLPRALES